MPLPKKQRPDFNQAQFVSYSLTEKERKTLKAMPFELVDVDTLLLRLAEDGYRITFRWDEYHSCHACWMIPVGEANPNNGFILSGRGSTPLKALKQAAWIHYQLFDGLWAAHYKADRDEDIDD
jgi:hypothetical protein